MNSIFDMLVQRERTQVATVAPRLASLYETPATGSIDAGDRAVHGHSASAPAQGVVQHDSAPGVPAPAPDKSVHAAPIATDIDHHARTPEALHRPASEPAALVALVAAGVPTISMTQERSRAAPDQNAPAMARRHTDPGAPAAPASLAPAPVHVAAQASAPRSPLAAKPLPVQAGALRPVAASAVVARAAAPKKTDAGAGRRAATAAVTQVPDVHITIGRVEVRALESRARADPRERVVQPMSLDQYLSRRNHREER